MEPRGLIESIVKQIRTQINWMTGQLPRTMARNLQKINTKRPRRVKQPQLQKLLSQYQKLTSTTQVKALFGSPLTTIQKSSFRKSKSTEISGRQWLQPMGNLITTLRQSTRHTRLRTRTKCGSTCSIASSRI